MFAFGHFSPVAPLQIPTMVQENPTHTTGSVSLSGDTYTQTSLNGDYAWYRANRYGTGKLYYEYAIGTQSAASANGGAYFGFSSSAELATQNNGIGTNGVRVNSDSTFFYNGAAPAGFPAATGLQSAGDVWGCAIDTVAGLFWAHKNGVWIAGNPGAGTGGLAITTGMSVAPRALIYSGANPQTVICTIKLKASQFTYAIPTGFKSVEF